MLKLVVLTFLVAFICTSVVFWIANPKMESGRTFREWLKACPLWKDDVPQTPFRKT